jgi:putative flippase GtrA
MNLNKRSLRFLFSGLLVTFFYIFIAFFIIKFVNLNVSLANGIAFVLANFFSYLIHTTWTFSERIKKSNLIRFYTVSIIAFLMSLLIPYSLRCFGISDFLITLITSLSIPFLTYFLHSTWTYA